MEENLRNFLEKFAELERRVRKLSAEDRGLRDEVKKLRKSLQVAEAENTMLKEIVAEDGEMRRAARDRVSDLIARLSSLKDGSGGQAERASGSEAAHERGEGS